MADLRIDDTTTANAVAALRGAAGRVEPVVRAARTLDTEATGANSLAAGLSQAEHALANQLAGIGRTLTALATEIDRAATTLGRTDAMLTTADPQPAETGPVPVNGTQP